MTERRSKKPLPRPDEESKWFWEACRRHELFAERCRSCGMLRFYPRALCPGCLSSDTVYERLSGRGRVHTFTVTWQNQAPGFREELPYVMAYVELNEGPRILTNIVGCPPEEIRIGMPVEAEFEDATPEIGLPRFRPSRT